MDISGGTSRFSLWNADIFVSLETKPQLAPLSGFGAEFAPMEECGFSNPTTSEPRGVLGWGGVDDSWMPAG